MPKETKFYDLLEVSYDVNDNELKKAYRKKALRLHPDKGGDPELFKEVTHAYEVLSDPQKRSIYDSRGEAGLSEQGGMGGMDPQDLFASLFSNGGFGFGGGGRSGPQKGKDLVHRIAVSLEDLYKGKTTKLALTRHIICAKCEGKGGKEGAVKRCTTCSGRGFRVTLRQMGPMIQQIQQPCHECDTTGEMIDPKHKCKTCNGKKVVSERKYLEVHIDKGMKGGDVITFPGESDQSPDLPPGDVVIAVEEKPHDRFKREGDDLYVEVELDLLTALAGGQLAIKHLDDRALLVDIPPGIPVKHGELKAIRDQGMPSRRQHIPGDLYVRCNVKFPDALDQKMVEKLEKALPPRAPVEKFSSNVHIEEVELTTMDARQQRRQQSREDAMDEDGPGGPSVQCANQ